MTEERRALIGCVRTTNHLPVQGPKPLWRETGEQQNIYGPIQAEIIAEVGKI